MATLPQPTTSAGLGVSRVYLNGEFMRPEEATISPFDRGFIFGDGVYEVIPVFGGRLFRLRHHLQRLHDSLKAIDLASPLSLEQWSKVLQRLVDETGDCDQYVYLQVTRGVAPRNHAFPRDVLPTVFAYTQVKPFPETDIDQPGVAVITATDIRWQRCDIKSVSLLGAVMLRQQAEQAGAVETILLRDGLVTEGAATNVFLVVDGVVVTPPKGRLILTGITRDLVLEIARKHGIAVEERDVREAELASASEVWITSSTNEIKPVSAINRATVGDGRSGPVFKRVYGLYQNYKQAVREGKAE
jgi:D-alanine transaminase